VSYILDALKKSEEERGRKPSPVPARQAAPRRKLPDDQTAPESRPEASHVPYSAAGSQNRLKLVILLLLITSGVIIYFILGERPIEKTPENAQVTTGGGSEAQTADQPGSNTGAQSSFLKDRDQPMTISELRIPTVVAASEKEAEATAVTNAENIDEKLAKSRAPFAALERIPDLEITGHTYSSVPAKRTVVMNDRVWKEGDTIVEGVHLKEITRDGILLDVSGWPVVIGRSRGWKAVK